MSIAAFVLARGLAIHFVGQWLEGKRGRLKNRASGRRAAASLSCAA